MIRALTLLALSIFMVVCLGEAISDFRRWRRSKKNGVLRLMAVGYIRHESLRVFKFGLAVLGIYWVISPETALMSIALLLGVNSFLDLVDRRRKGKP